MRAPRLNRKRWTDIATSRIDVVAEIIEFFLAAGGVPGPKSVEAQRRARLVAAIVALVTILAGRLISGTTADVILVTAGSIVGLWILAFSVVDFIKEFPPVPWQSVMAIIVAGAALALALEYTLGARAV
jgi:hypothetical protein